MSRTLQTVLVCSLLVVCCAAQARGFKVMPWNNHTAAVSLTFDDAKPVQLDRVIPELNKRHLRGTFFLIISKLTRIDDWRRAQAEGQEIGSHSVSHEHPANLTKESEETQVEDAKQFLDSNFKTSVCIFAYPYSETSAGLTFWVKRYDFAARGWRGNGDLLYVLSDTEPDWYSLPSQPAYSKYTPAVYKGWIDKAMSMQAWTTLQLHGVGDPSTGWEPIPNKTLLYLLDYLKAAEQRGVWVAPFGEVAAYLRAQKVVERAQARPVDGGNRFTWEEPTPFPKGVLLKVALEGRKRLRLYQGGRLLRADRNGIYSVAFDARELVVKGGL